MQQQMWVFIVAATPPCVDECLDQIAKMVADTIRKQKGTLIDCRPRKEAERVEGHLRIDPKRRKGLHDAILKIPRVHDVSTMEERKEVHDHNCMLA